MKLNDYQFIAAAIAAEKTMSVSELNAAFLAIRFCADRDISLSEEDYEVLLGYLDELVVKFTEAEKQEN